VEDHHVDRLDVEARQRVELTSTNRSIGFIALISQCSRKKQVSWRKDLTQIILSIGGRLLAAADRDPKHPLLAW
jgi:hypothetical protein